MASDRFKELKEVDEESKSDIEDVDVESTEEASTDSTVDAGESRDTISSATDAGSPKKKGNIKDRNPRVAMFPPEEHKEGYDDALRKVKAICSLADEPEPNKLSEFSGAVLKHGYEDIQSLCHELGLEEAYEEYSEVVEG